MLTKQDTESLVVKLFVSLAAHGDEFAEFLLDKYFTEEETSRECSRQRRCTPVAPPPPVLPPRRLTRLRASQVKFTIQYGDTYRLRNKCFVVGGYSSEGDIYVVYRIMGGRPKDGLAKVLPPEHIVIRDDTDPNRVAPEHIDKLMSQSSCDRFSQNGRRWTLLTAEELAPVVEGKVFRQSLPKRE